MSRCDLFLDNYATCYYSGQQIVGRLRCFFKSPKSTAGIHVKISGSALVEWSESRTRNDSNNRSHTEWVRYRGTQDFINEKLNLLYEHGNKIDVPAGEHVFPFTYTLPADLPSSYDSTHGKIKYTIKGYVDRSFQFDYKAETEINVVEVLDLNRCPNVLVPVNITKQKSLGYLCWRSGHIDMTINIPYTGFVPGQSVPLTLQMSNMSRTSVPTIRFNIDQHIDCYSQYPTRKSKSETNMITSTKDTGVGAHGERTYELHLQIPASFTPINFKLCSIIDVAYYLNIEVVIPGCHTNLTSTIRIEVGNVALVDSGYRVQQFPPIMSLVEPEVDVIGQEDDFVVIGPSVNPSAPPQPPPIGLLPPPFGQAGPSIVPVPVPSAPPPGPGGFSGDGGKPGMGMPEVAGPGFGWTNPTSDTTMPPAYDDLFKSKD